MSELLNPGILNLASLAVSVALLLVGLLLWFFVNRASSRANEQIELLQALLDQQKRQNALLRRLCEASAPEKEDVVEPTVAGKAKGRMSLSARWQSAKYLDRCASYDAHLHDSGR